MATIVGTSLLGVYRYVRSCDQIVTPAGEDVQRIAQQSQWSKERISGQMVHSRVFYAALRESGPLKLPIKMIATIFEHVNKSGFVIWILKIIKGEPP
jgi:hypothetical protein